MAGPEGIPAGHEVTISYGSQWPNEAFLLLFGFAPDGNPADGVILFPSFSDLVEAWQRHQQVLSCPEGQGGEDARTLEERVARSNVSVEEVLLHPELAEVTESGKYDRLIVTQQGIDPRMGDAIALVAAVKEEARFGEGRAEDMGWRMSAAEQRTFLLAACRAYEGRLERVASLIGTTITPPAALQYRNQKLRIIKQVIESLI